MSNLKKKKVTFIEKPDISNDFTSGISHSTDFRIDGSISDNNIDNNSNIAFCENPLNAYRSSANETGSVNTSCGNEFISTALGENVIPERFTNDKFWEELSHPHLFPTRKFGFQTKRKVQLSPSKYFN